MAREWCELRFPSKPPKHKRYKMLLSTSLFYFPKYTKAYRVGGVKDETHAKQRSFLQAVQFYLSLFDLDWFRRNVMLRIYYDSSLFIYETENGTKPWLEVLQMLNEHGSFQLVRFECTDRRFREQTGEHDLHRGLFGAFVRFHAMFDFESNRIAKCICLVDIDSLYTKAWWEQHIEFLADARHNILSFTGPFEMNIHGYLPPESTYVQPFMKGGFTSFKKLLPSNLWTEFPKYWTSFHSTLRYLDAYRYLQYKENASQERLFQDFGYGFDEAVLNDMLLDHSSYMGLKVVTLHRTNGTQISTFVVKLTQSFEWNGQRSVAMQQLCREMGFKSVGQLLAYVSSMQTRLKSMEHLESFIKSLRPYVATMSELQIDARIIHLIRTFTNDGKSRDSKDFLVGAHESRRILGDLAAWKMRTSSNASKSRGSLFGTSQRGRQMTVG